ncbi:Por_Secre_tail domain-containing protein [Durusdinium trenchii]|uniref:Por_Secre_tail domain-containing protein n=1 Tax=Durusdinium trenchii TaxID=1381693 RepID=A0ABP0S6H9_9DINO
MGTRRLRFFTCTLHMDRRSSGTALPSRRGSWRRAAGAAARATTRACRACRALGGEGLGLACLPRTASQTSSRFANRRQARGGRSIITVMRHPHLAFGGVQIVFEGRQTGNLTMRTMIGNIRAAMPLVMAMVVACQAQRFEWVQVGNRVTSGARARRGDIGCGTAMSGDGSTVVLGGPQHYRDGRKVGLVKVFTETNGTWTQLGDTIFGLQGYSERMGGKVAISEDGRTIAATGCDDCFDFGLGVTRVYRFKDGAWTQLGSDIINTAELVFEPEAIAMSEDGNTIAIGAYTGGNEALNRYPCTRYSLLNCKVGQVRVLRFSESTGTWFSLGNTIFGPDRWMYMGFSVALGADGNSDVVGTRKYAELWQLAGGSWVPVGSRLDKKDTFGGGFDEDHAAVAMSADARVFAVSNRDKGFIHVADPLDLGRNKTFQAGYSFGEAIALSRNGTTLVVGAPLVYGSNNHGQGNVGLVSVYRKLDDSLDEFGKSWEQLGQEILCSWYDDKTWGKDVSVSSDGSRLAIGYCKENVAARVYDLQAVPPPPTPSPTPKPEDLNFPAIAGAAFVGAAVIMGGAMWALRLRHLRTVEASSLAV